MEPIEVKHDEPNHRFVVTLSGEEAHLLYRRSGSCMDFYRTYVPESFRGRGIAEKLCKTAFEYAKANHFTVIPTCSYISGAYLKRHPEYRVLIQSGEVA
ncbi:MAG: N-acetyltransferase [Candidatus Omnitrophica bacterium]|nr:N-acetyltransferase [Candidatus Omnitrophota bacterium]